jgi:hypothetical protein
LLTRVLDVAVLLLLAVVVLMPRPDVRVQIALPDADQRQRVAELQTTLLAKPGDAPAALELADIFLDARHPDWALAALSEALAAHPDDHRLHGRRSLALADHFDARGAYQSGARALALCRTGSIAPCGEGERSRLELLVATLDRVKDIDMRKDPNSAKDQIIKGLRPAYLQRRPAARKPPAGAEH